MSMPNPTGPESGRFTIRLPRWRWIVLATMMLIISAGTALPRWISSRLDASNIERFRVNLDRLKAGETDFVLLLCTRDTDSLLKQLRGMPEIETVVLEHTDVTEKGLQHMSTLPELRHLVVYADRGLPGVSDRGLWSLRTCTNLESIELYGTSVTDGGIADLKQALPAVNVQR